MSELEKKLVERQQLESRLKNAYRPMLRRAVHEAFCDWELTVPQIAEIAKLPTWRVQELLLGPAAKRTKDDDS